MGLAVCPKESIGHGIAAAMLVAVRTCVTNEASSAEHLRGTLDPVEAQAALYGLSWPVLLSELRPSLSAGLINLPDRTLPAESQPVIATAGALPEEA